MSEAVGLDIAKCTKAPATCTAVAQAHESLVFYDAVEGLEPAGPDMRAILGAFVASCTQGTCLGQNYELASRMLRDIRDLDWPQQ